MSTPQANEKLDFGPLNAPNAAAREMGGAIGDVGRAIGDFAQRMQAGVNYGIAADVDRQMRQETADFQQSRVGRADEDNWQAEWKERSDGLWGKINDEHAIGPDLKRQLTVNYKNWQSSSGIEVQMMANKQKVNRAIDRVMMDADAAAQAGDPHGVNEAFKGAVEGHLLLPEVAEFQIKQHLVKIQEYEALNYIMNNVSGAVDYLEAKTEGGNPKNLKLLPQDKRLSLLNTARSQFVKYQSDNLSDMIAGLQNGEVKTPEELSALVETRVISPKQRNSYEAAYSFGRLNKNPTAIAELGSAIANYNPSGAPGGNPSMDPEYAALQVRVATGGFPQNIQSSLNDTLTQKRNPGNVLNTQVAREAFDGIEARFKDGFYGKFNIKTTDQTGVVTNSVDKKIYEQAIATKSRIQDLLRQYLIQNPGATGADANKIVSDAQRNAVVKGGTATLLSVLLPTQPATDGTPEAQRSRLDAILEKGRKQ